MSLRAADNVIKIGALLPISGPGSYFGVQDKQGVELALDQLNKGRHISGPALSGLHRKSLTYNTGRSGSLYERLAI